MEVQYKDGDEEEQWYNVSVWRMACGSVDSDFVFRLFTKGSDDPVTLILDLRPYKYFKRSHVSQAFCVRMSSNGKALMVLTIIHSCIFFGG